MEKGERITVEMVERQLGLNGYAQNNTALPVVMSQPAESAERELILRQLFLLRQDVEFLKQFASQGTPPVQSQMGLPLMPQESGEVTPSLHIDEESEYFIKNSSIGDMSLEDLEREAIARTLKFFNNNRRASAKSLGMSERTLYRKIDQYGLERKIKSNG